MPRDNKLHLAFPPLTRYIASLVETNCVTMDNDYLQVVDYLTITLQRCLECRSRVLAPLFLFISRGPCIRDASFTPKGPKLVTVVASGREFDSFHRPRLLGRGT